MERLPRGYTCILQPCVASTIRSLLGGATKRFMLCVTQKYRDLSSVGTLPTPGPKDRSEYMKDACDQIQDTTTEDTFKLLLVVRYDILLSVLRIPVLRF